MRCRNGWIAVGEAAAILERLAGLYVPHGQPDVDQRVAAWYYGADDEDVPGWLTLCKSIAPEPIAEKVYQLHVALDVRQGDTVRGIKDWAYATAAKFALTPRKGAMRHRRPIANYDREWGHQAARDGLALAMWPHLADEVPGRDPRCAAHHVGHDAYMRVREEVRDQTCGLIAGFRADMVECHANRFSRDFRTRWEARFGRAFPKDA